MAETGTFELPDTIASDLYSIHPDDTGDRTVRASFEDLDPVQRPRLRVGGRDVRDGSTLVVPEGLSPEIGLVSGPLRFARPDLLGT